MQMNTAPDYKVEDNTTRQAQAKVSIFAVGHAMRIFAESTYTRPIEAVVRETIANAMDASRGKKFDVTAPSMLDPNFKVRDYGVGMDEAFFLDGYAKVGFSTKRESNDEVGGFGQGRFAAFAYKACDQFYVRGVKDGQFFLGSVWHDADFEIYVQVENRGPTDEENGVEVIIPVEVKDHSAFYEAIQIFTEFLDPKPDCAVTPITRPVIFEGKDKSWRISKFNSGNSLSVKHHPIRAVMGGVPYKLDLNQIYGAYNSSQYMNIAIADLIFPIGALSIPASREELRYDDKTKTAIKAKIDQIKNEIKAEVADRQKNLPSDFARWTDTGLGEYAVALGDSLKKTVRTAEIPDLFLIQDLKRAREFGGRSLVKQENVEFVPNKTYLVYVLDTQQWRKRYQSHVQQAISDADNALTNAPGNFGTGITKYAKGVVILLNSEKAVKTVLGDVPYIKTSQIPEPPKQPRQPRVITPGGTGPAVKVKRSPKIGRWNGSQFVMQDCDYSAKDLVYIPGKLTQIDEKYSTTWYYLRDTDEAKNIVMVPEADLDLAQKAGWKDVQEWGKALFTPTVLEGLGYLSKWRDLQYTYRNGERVMLNELNLLFNHGLHLPKEWVDLEAKLKMIIKVVEADEDKTTLAGQMRTLANHFKIDFTTAPTYDLQGEFERFITDRPFLKVMLKNQIFSEAQDAKVDVPTLLAAAKKAL